MQHYILGVRIWSSKLFYWVPCAFLCLPCFGYVLFCVLVPLVFSSVSWSVSSAPLLWLHPLFPAPSLHLAQVSPLTVLIYTCSYNLPTVHCWFLHHVRIPCTSSLLVYPWVPIHEVSLCFWCHSNHFLLKWNSSYFIQAYLHCLSAFL